MSGERPTTTERSPYLPPLEAWKQPDKWMNLETGKLLPDIKKLKFTPDDRGFLRPHEVVDVMVDTFFWKDYTWPYDPTDPQTRPDDHHFYWWSVLYDAERHDQSPIPQKFRELPTNIGRMPRQLHNAIHGLTIQSDVPKLDAMAEYVDSYTLAEQTFQRLSKVANQIVARSGVVPPPHALPKLTETREAFIESFFREHFPNYSIAIDLLKVSRPDELLEAQVQQLNHRRNRRVLRKIGGLPTQKYLNFTPLLQAA